MRPSSLLKRVKFYVECTHLQPPMKPHVGLQPSGIRHEPQASAAPYARRSFQITAARGNKKGIEGEAFDKTHYVRGFAKKH